LARKRSVGSAVGTLAEKTADASVLLSLPDHRTGLPGRSGSSLTTDHVSGSGGRLLAPSNVSDRSSRPRSALPLAPRSWT
jgi:hypothetical protein